MGELQRLSVKRPSISALSTGLLDILSPAATEYEKDNLSKVDLGQLFQWVLCFAVVNFDLEKGHFLELTYPPIPFSDEERHTLCFSAFPDSNSAEHSGDTVFSFRMRNSTFTQSLYLKQTSNAHDFDSANNSGLPIDTDGFTYGTVFFRQQSDQEVKRGFFQKALVVLTPHSWPGLFRYISSMMGPLVMQRMVDTRKCDSRAPNGFKDITSLEVLHNACLEISLWPSPPFSWSSEQYYDSMEIPITLLGKTTLFSFPPHNLYPQQYPLKSRSETMECFEKTKSLLCNPLRAYQIFRNHLDHLWTCWELMVTGQPIYVISDSPSAASELVQCLIELVKPVPFGGDFRPYFTIQDADFSSLASKNRNPPQAVVLGVTNRVFSKVLEGWPNCICIGKEKARNEKVNFLDLESLSFYMGVESNIDSSIESCSFKLHKNYFSKDKKLLKAILEVGVGVKGTDAINNMIRSHFVELSQRFLHPLNRYFDNLVVGSPMEMSLSKLRPCPEVKPFKQDEFLRLIEQSVPSLPLNSKRPIADFYKSFLMSPNFASWLSQKTKSAYRNWRSVYLQLLANSDLEYWVESRIADNIVECIDLLMRLREEINRYASFFVVQGKTVCASYSSATPQPIATEASVSEIKVNEEEVKKDVNDIPTIIESIEDIDLTSVSTQGFKRHFKVKTTPNAPTSPFRFNNDNTLDSTTNLSDLLPKSSTKSLSGIGDFIPSVEQYKRLLEQLDLVIHCLPPELVMNIGIRPN